jgi:hypothetical protein
VSISYQPSDFGHQVSGVGDQYELSPSHNNPQLPPSIRQGKGLLLKAEG